MFIIVLAIGAFIGVLLAASLCMIAGHADEMLEEIELSMRERSLEKLFDKEKVG